MHELPVMESVLNVVRRHAMANKVNKVITISLRVGEMSDLEDEWMQRYFDYLAKDTVAQGAKLKIERIPVSIKCGGCGQTYTINIRETKGNKFTCPHCGSTEGTLVAGREYFIKDMEVA